MKRRTFIGGLGLAAAMVPLGRAQQASPMRRIAVLMGYAESETESQSRVGMFRNTLAKLGWIEGKNVSFEIRWSTACIETIARDAEELVALKPDLILSSNTPTTSALIRQTRCIPIVFATVADPVESGFVASMPRPGGNVTGFTNLEGSVAGKWLELIKEIAPSLERVAFLFNPATAPFSETYLKPFEAAAGALKVTAVAAAVNNTADLEAALQINSSLGGIMVMPGPFFANRSEQIVALAAGRRMPAVYPFRYYAEQGGLMAYGNDQADNYRRAAEYADRILKGTPPADLPVQAPVKFELVINLKTAKAIGLEVPARLLQQADAVLE